MSLTRRGFFRVALCGAAATAAWVPSMHLLLEPDQDAIRAGLLERQLWLWEQADKRAIDQMRLTNPEWDFMGRTFLALALGNLTLGDRSRQPRHLAAMDALVTDTLEVERELGQRHFLLPYADYQPWVHPSGRSLFVDGEIALMAGARCMVAPDEALLSELDRRAAQIRAQMEAGPILCAESYPDECWLFCNTAALVALRMHDVLRGASTHDAFIGRWVERAREVLIDAPSGLLVSSFTLDGTPKDGPEGSSIFFGAHCLLPLAPDLARDQYAKARAQLGQVLLGFGWAKEWPPTATPGTDVDSGPIVPVLEASAGASGHALIGARAFGDEAFFRALTTSLQLGAFPDAEGGGLTYRAGAQIADAVLLYALSQGPLWAALSREV